MSEGDTEGTQVQPGSKPRGSTEPGKNINSRYGERPDDPWYKDPNRARSNAARFAEWVLETLFDKPVDWVRENISDKFRGPKYYYYHRQFKRVPTIDQCYIDDFGCFFEADEQHKRDRMVEGRILIHLRNRYTSCAEYNWWYDREDKCMREWRDYTDASLNYFIKYGDLGSGSDVQDVYMKQKHRLIWERREKERIRKLMEKYPDLYKNEPVDARDCIHCVTGRYPPDLDGRKVPPEHIHHTQANANNNGNSQS